MAVDKLWEEAIRYDQLRSRNQGLAWVKHGKIDDEQIPHFTPRDLRRTCAQLMQRNGVDDRLSDLLQSHGQTGVVGQHYRNNPEAYLPEKLKAMAGFEAALSKVLD